jgi:hypothetical protein
MAPPNVKASMVAGPLANVSVMYQPTGFIADQVFPIIPDVPTKCQIATYGKGAFFRDEAQIRAPGTEAARGGYPTGHIDVNTKEYAFASEVTDEDRRHAKQQGAPPLKPDEDAIALATGKILLRKERIVRDLVVNTVWADGNAGGEDAAGLWAPKDNTNTFLDDIAKGIDTIHSKTGVMPNKLVIDLGTYLALKECAAVLDKIKHTQRGVITADLLAGVLDLEEVLVGKASYSTAKEKKNGTDFTAAKIWEINATKGMAFLFYAPPAPGLKVPSAGYQARENYETGLSRKTEVWRENSKHQDVYEVAELVDIVAVGADLGYLWADTRLT